MKLDYKSTICAGFVGYITQSITINFSPLLYITFGLQFGISLTQISALIGVCFAVQLLTDLLAARFSDKLPVRASVVSAHLLAVIGIAGFGVFPFIMPSYLGLMVAVILSGIGSGLVEVLISPIVESCPTPVKKKSAYMSLLHSFYCWGQALVVLLSTVYFSVFGIENWRLLAALWAIPPFIGALMFTFVPLYPMHSESTDKNGKSYLKNKVFWIIALMMLTSGAAEMTMGQWASSFAESGLHIDKALGDILGPCTFAIFMGTSRVLYARFSHKVSLKKLILASSLLCIATYLLAAFSPIPLLSLIACGVCGLSVGVLWPGNLSNAAGLVDGGGVSMFATLALAGDLGCMLGPSIAGDIADRFGGEIRAAFVFSAIFPLTLLTATIYLISYNKKIKKQIKG